MANILTGLIPDIYEALDVVSRENVGFVQAASPDHDIERAAQGQSVLVPIYGAETATDITVGVTPPDDGDNTTNNVSVLLDSARRVPVRLTGKDARGLNSGVGSGNYVAGRFAQGFRTLANEMEVTLAAKALLTSRAVGTAGTTPFASDISATALAYQVLSDNGAPKSDLRMVVNSAAAANLRSLGQLTKANEAGTDSTLRTGALLDINGFMIGESGASSTLSHTKGTGTGYLVNDASLSAGDTVIAADTGTGTILAGDTVTYAADPANQYVVTAALAGGSFTIGGQGLKVAIPDNNAITVGASYDGNVGFSRSAFALASRAPELPDEGDLAIDREIVTDPFSGLSFEVAVYPQYRQIQYEISLVWGSLMVKSEHAVTVLG